MSRILALALLVAVALIGSAVPPASPATAQAQSDTWSERAPLLVPRSEMSIAAVGSRIYVMGGYPGTRVTVDEVQVYDASTDSWSFGPRLPRPLHHNMAAAVDGRLYFFGGESGDPIGGAANFENATYVLDDQTSAWLPRAPMPTARSGGGTGVIDGKIYVAGGRPPHGNDFAVYDPAADRWQTLPDLPAQRNHLAVGAIGGRLYVAGGRFGGGVGSPMTDLLEIYDPGRSSWIGGAPMLAPRAGVASIVANGCLYVIGGEGNDADPRGIFDRNELYDPASDSWRSLAPLPMPIHGLTGGAYLDGWLHIPGGATHRGVSGADVTVSHQVYPATITCGPAAD
jgi:N-acetylneuraminic acid mutarotase